MTLTKDAPILPYLRSAVEHPDGLAVMHRSWLREEAIERGLIEPRGFGVVRITQAGKLALVIAETPEASAVAPLGYIRAAGIKSLAEGNHTTVYPAPREGYLIPVFALAPVQQAGVDETHDPRLLQLADDGCPHV